MLYFYNCETQKKSSRENLPIIKTSLVSESRKSQITGGCERHALEQAGVIMTQMKTMTQRRVRVLLPMILGQMDTKTTTNNLNTRAKQQQKFRENYNESVKTRAKQQQKFRENYNESVKTRDVLKRKLGVSWQNSAH